MSKNIGLDYRDKPINGVTEKRDRGDLVDRLFPAFMPLIISGAALAVGWYFFA